MYTEILESNVLPRHPFAIEVTTNTPYRDIHKILLSPSPSIASICLAAEIDSFHNKKCPRRIPSALPRLRSSLFAERTQLLQIRIAQIYLTPAHHRQGPFWIWSRRGSVIFEGKVYGVSRPMARVACAVQSRGTPCGMMRTGCITRLLPETDTYISLLSVLT